MLRDELVFVFLVQSLVGVMKKLVFFSFACALLSVVLCRGAVAQDLSYDFWPGQNLAVLHDFGLYWAANSMFKPYRWELLRPALTKGGAPPVAALAWLTQDLNHEAALVPAGKSLGDSLRVRWWNGVLLQQPVGSGKPFSGFSGTTYSRLNLWYRQNFLVQLYLRATSDPGSLPHFTGRPREVRRFGLNAAEFDRATLGYHNSWLTFQFGRSRQRWGPFESDNLVLSQHAPASDHFMVEFRHKRITGRFFYGFLESVQDSANINRYLVGHGIQYSNHRNLILGVSEIIIYSGKDRPFDLAFLNPLLPVLEVELNERTNEQAGTKSSNSVWSFAFDWLPLQGLRLSGNLVIDEIKLEKAERDAGRPDATAYRMRLAYSTFVAGTAVTTFAGYTKVGTYTFRHGDGMNNFVSRGIPLGSPIGSDSDEFSLGARLILKNRLVLYGRFGYNRSGEHSILSDPLLPNVNPRSTSFPSGDVLRTRMFEGRVEYRPRRNLSLAIAARFSSTSGRFHRRGRYLLFSINSYAPWLLGF